MNGDTSVVYDPDATDLQISALDNIGLDQPQLSDMSDPKVLRILLWYQRVTLEQLKASSRQRTDLEREGMQLRQAREDLRVHMARLEERVKGSWLEIPISMASGFAINTLTVNPRDGVGWFLLVVSLVMLVLLRGSDATATIKGRLIGSAKGGENA
jgi:hypothetical protein